MGEVRRHGFSERPLLVEVCQGLRAEVPHYRNRVLVSEILDYLIAALILLILVSFILRLFAPLLSLLVYVVWSVISAIRDLVLWKGRY